MDTFGVGGVGVVVGPEDTATTQALVRGEAIRPGMFIENKRTLGSQDGVPPNLMAPVAELINNLADKLVRQSQELGYRERGDVNPTPGVGRSVVIRQQLRGYQVAVGCQTVCFETAAKLCKELERYLNNPEAVEREYRTK